MSDNRIIHVPAVPTDILQTLLAEIVLLKNRLFDAGQMIATWKASHDQVSELNKKLSDERDGLWSEMWFNKLTVQHIHEQETKLLNLRLKALKLEKSTAEAFSVEKLKVENSRLTVANDQLQIVNDRVNGINESLQISINIISQKYRDLQLYVTTSETDTELMDSIIASETFDIKVCPLDDGLAMHNVCMTIDKPSEALAEAKLTVFTLQEKVKQLQSSNTDVTAINQRLNLELNELWREKWSNNRTVAAIDKNESKLKRLKETLLSVEEQIEQASNIKLLSANLAKIEVENEQLKEQNLKLKEILKEPCKVEAYSEYIKAKKQLLQFLNDHYFESSSA